MIYLSAHALSCHLSPTPLHRQLALRCFSDAALLLLRRGCAAAGRRCGLGPEGLAAVRSSVAVRAAAQAVLDRRAPQCGAPLREQAQQLLDRIGHPAGGRTLWGFLIGK